MKIVFLSKRTDENEGAMLGDEDEYEMTTEGVVSLLTDAVEDIRRQNYLEAVEVSVEVSGAARVVDVNGVKALGITLEGNYDSAKSMKVVMKTSVPAMENRRTE